MKNFAAMAKKGGARAGSGRKKIGVLPRTRVGITLDPNLVPALRALSESARATALDVGLTVAMPATAAASFECDLVYNAISEAIHRLERIRDYDPASGAEDLDGCHWTAEQASLHRLLNRFWDELRSEPSFKENNIS